MKTEDLKVAIIEIDNILEWIDRFITEVNTTESDVEKEIVVSEASDSEEDSEEMSYQPKLSDDYKKELSATLNKAKANILYLQAILTILSEPDGDIEVTIPPAESKFIKQRLLAHIFSLKRISWFEQEPP